MVLHLMLLFLVLPRAENPVARAASHPRLPMLTNEEAWKRLPGAPESPQPLPAWARTLAGPMPLTTARMIELDSLHRTGDRLDARLRALTRWAAADANRCEYARTIAAADFARTGAIEDIETVLKDPARLPALDRAAMAFARRMMLEAHAVTDQEVKHLIELAGEERVVALVALVAHASFQDRILLALNIAGESGNDPPPVTVRFGRPEPEMPPAGVSQEQPKFRRDNGHASPEWRALQAKIEEQRARPGRIRVPSREQVLKRLGENHPAAWQAGIIWSRVCYGYQPELTDAWFETAGAFRKESKLDRLFHNAIFWVVTDSLQCFY